MTENEAIGVIKRLIGISPSERIVGAVNMVTSALEEIQQYRAIGTVGECQEAMERQKPKKPVKDKYNHDCCPDCGWIVYQDEWGGRYLPHCENCGQAILWEGENETSI